MRGIDFGEPGGSRTHLDQLNRLALPPLQLQTLNVLSRFPVRTARGSGVGNWRVGIPGGN